MYYAVPMHMHSVWESEASMEGHFYHANKLGIKHMYISDHDSRMGRTEHHIDSFDFTKGELLIDEHWKDPLRPRTHGFTILNKAEDCDVYFTDEKELCVDVNSSSDKWSGVSMEFLATPHRHECAILADFMLHLGMKFADVDDDVRIVVDVMMSRRPPDFEFAHILYVYGNCDGLGNKYETVKKMEPVNGICDFEILKDAKDVGGGDNTFKKVTFTVLTRRGKSTKFYLNYLKTSRKLRYEEARCEQQKLATEIGKKYDVTPYVITEITEAGPHKNVFSTKVPIIDYQSMNYKVSEEYAINQILSHGAIFSLNHPFERFKDMLVLKPELKKDKISFLQKAADEFINNNAFGASLIEVGFTEGRGEFTLDDHLTLWDKLSEAGIFITGYGDSDNHSNIKNWFDGNNFVGYIYAQNPCEDDFILSMKGGNLYTGDPVYLQDVEISFKDEFENPMGSVVFTDKNLNAKLSVKGVKDEMRVVWVANGKTVKEENFTEEYDGFLEILPEKKVNFVRAQMYMGERCVMLTNPIYYTADKDVFEKTNNERRRKID